MIQPAVRAWRVVIQFQVARIIEHSVAALTLRTVLVEKEVVHLSAGHARPRLPHSLFNSEERNCDLSVVRALRRFGCVVDFIEWDFIAAVTLGCKVVPSQSVHHYLVSPVPNVDSDPLAIKLLCRYAGGGTAAERVEHNSTFVR